MNSKIWSFKPSFLKQSGQHEDLLVTTPYSCVSASCNSCSRCEVLGVSFEVVVVLLYTMQYGNLGHTVLMDYSPDMVMICVRHSSSDVLLA